jgi:hypothetical protein
MSDSNRDDALPAAIGDTLKHIHEPPVTPREEMWERIQARRQNRRVVRIRFAKPQALRIALAAAAILLVGFLSGRLWENHDVTTDHSDLDDLRSTTAANPAPAITQAQLLHAANHFNRSGVLLAQFADTVQDEGPLDPEFHQWGRDLLTNTRLLLDSPLAVDPQYRRLLRELEFTLAEIVQASAGAVETEERQWVAGQLRDRSLVERLRLIVPALPGSRDL